MTRFITLLSWALLAFALAACGGIAYFVWTIEGDSQVRIQAMKRANDNTEKLAETLRIRALANETANDRTQLTDIANAEILSVADLIDAVGSATGVRITLGQALPESTPSQLAGTGVRPVGFVAQASGSFSALMRAEQLLEKLPLVSTVQRFDIERDASSGTAQASWHMSAYIRVYAKADPIP